MRSCGILMHISSLPSPYGIGTFGEEAEKFADWLKEAGQKYWQVLPIGPTGYGDSPYQPFSSFAGNPLLIDLDELVEHGYLAKKSLDNSDYGADPSYVDFDIVNRNKTALPAGGLRGVQPTTWATPRSSSRSRTGSTTTRFSWR